MTTTTMGTARRGSMLEGAFWMVALSILLCWLPPFGQLIAGFIGGYRSGGVGAAFVASLLPAVIAAGAVFLLLTFVPLPFLNVLGGAVALILMIASGALVTLGAIMGALLR